MHMIRRAILAFALIAGFSPAIAQVPPPVPALPDTERRTTYSISASTCACSVGFQLYGDSTDIANWLTVWVNGVQQTGNWSITSPTGSLGTIPRPITDAVLTFTAAQTGTVQIVGARRPRRTSQFSENRGVAARDMNQVLSDIEAQNRELWDRQFRTVQAPPGETLALLPVLASRMNMGACFDTSGNLSSCVSVPSGTFTAGNGILFTGTNPTTISASIAAGSGVVITGTNPMVVSAPGPTVASIAAMKALDTSGATYAVLTAVGRAGQFVWTPGNYTTQVAADTNEGVYVKANAIAASSGAWVRQFDGVNFWARWFGAVADYATDNTTLINSMIVVANLQNTSAVDGRQSALYINVDGGVKFKSNTLQWLPASTYVYIYVRYFANSDTTVGVATGGLGTNELQELAVASGYPLNPFGSYVAEKIFNAPIHPATKVNIQKNTDNSIGAHTLPGQAIQPVAAQSALASQAFISDENLNRFRITYSRYGSNDPLNGVFPSVETRTTSLQCAGCNGAGAWGGAVPATGAVVRGMTTLSRYVVTGSSLDTLSTDWLSGTAVAGEFLMNERAVFQASISGTTLTVTSMLQGSGNIANGHTLSGMFANNGITAGTTISSQSSGTAGGVGVYVINNSQTVANTTMAAGNVTSVALSSVANVDAIYTPVQFGFKGHFIISKTTFALTPACSSGVAGAISTFTDSNTVTWGANIAGGGANTVMGFCNGTNWTVAAK